MKLFARSLIIFLFFFLFSGLFVPSALAVTTPFLVTEGFTSPGGNSNIFYKSLNLPHSKPGDKLIISSSPDGTGDMEVADVLQVQATFGYVNLTTYTYNYSTGNCDVKPLPATDVSYLLSPFYNIYNVKIISVCATPKMIGPIYLVYISPDPTPTPTPTPIPGPAPFLDLPWDYEGKGLSFSEAALSINSYFDHEYPLLSSGLGEPSQALGLIVNFTSPTRIKEPYSSHDGYDYGRLAKVNIGDPVLAAAGGIATFINSCMPCGNTILIDHENGYQTRYLHLQKDGLITSTPGEKIRVSTGQIIGKVGATGNVNPAGDTGAHIHFGVFEDKNKDGNFDDNVPDGVTDPFGWQSKVPDPWEIYTFFYNGQNRTGNRSYYLWKKKIDNLDANLTSNGGVFTSGKYKVTFPQGSSNQNLNLNIVAAPIVKTLDDLRSVGTSIIITASDSLGNLITNFSKLFSIGIDFSSLDLSRYNQDTLSIYSSTDGQSWKKETTIIDFIKKTATVNLDHLTHFALMAQRADAIAPVTSPTLNGQQGQANWFRSDVSVSLDAKDNEGGLGVDYTLYKKGSGDWETYKESLVFNSEGHHKIEFYSVDNDENIESVKSVEFDIDKTPPEAKIQFDTNTKDLVISGVDNSGYTTVDQASLKKNKGQFIITDKAGNYLTLISKDREHGKEAKLRLESLAYNNNATIILDKNKFHVEYSLEKDKNNIRQLEQKFEIKDEIKIKIKYDSKKNKSTIITKIKGTEKIKEIKDGLILLQLVTEKGTLKYSY